MKVISSISTLLISSSEIGSDLSMLCSAAITFITIARAPCGAMRCTVSRLKVLLSIENLRQFYFSHAPFYSH